MNRLKMSNMVKRRGLRGARAALAALLWALRGQTSPTLDRAPFLRAVSFALPALALGGVLLWSTPADAQTATVLVKNTGQPSSGSHTIDSSVNTGYAQAFTTGANPAGYTLSSIGFDFASITATSTAGAHLAVTLNEVSSGDPGSALCTLTDPATFSGSGVQDLRSAHDWHDVPNAGGGHDVLCRDRAGGVQHNGFYLFVQNCQRRRGHRRRDGLVDREYPSYVNERRVGLSQLLPPCGRHGLRKQQPAGVHRHRTHDAQRGREHSLGHEHRRCRCGHRPRKRYAGLRADRHGRVFLLHRHDQRPAEDERLPGLRDR